MSPKENFLSHATRLAEILHSKKYMNIDCVIEYNKQKLYVKPCAVPIMYIKYVKFLSNSIWLKTNYNFMFRSNKHAAVLGKLQNCNLTLQHFVHSRNSQNIYLRFLLAYLMVMVLYVAFRFYCNRVNIICMTYV